MSITSDIRKLSLQSVGTLHGEPICYAWDQPITDAAVWLPADAVVISTKATNGILQTAPDAAGPFTTAAALDGFQQRSFPGHAWFRTFEADGDTDWNISIEITDAVRGRTDRRTDEPGKKGLRTGEHSQAWNVEADQLRHPDGTAVEPERGHRIITQFDETFRVMPLTKDGELWEWLDPSGQSWLRIHTKERS